MGLVGRLSRRAVVPGVIAVGAGCAAALGAVIARQRRGRYMPVRRGDGYFTVRLVTVDRPVAVVLELWRSEPQLSTILGRAITVETRPDGRRDYIAPECDTGAGWSADAVIDEQAGSARWRLRDGRLRHDGRMELTEAPGDRATEVRVELTYPGGRLRHAARTLTGGIPTRCCVPCCAAPSRSSRAAKSSPRRRDRRGGDAWRSGRPGWRGTG